MILHVQDVKVDFRATHHANYQWGATFTWPDGKKSYGEYQTVGEAIKWIKSRQKEKNHEEA